MRFITTKDIESWANTMDCKYHLPHLIRKLILVTVDNSCIKHIQFPYGEDIQTGGFDGELLIESDNIFVPLGESVWEFGTTQVKGKKATEDYEKRKENTLGKNPTKTTYINVSAKKYRDKNKWVLEKKNEKFWKDVKYIDAIDIEQWLELAPTVELWLAEKLCKSTLGIYTSEEYWKRWSENKSIKIVPEILLGESRLKEIEIVKSFLINDEKVLYIKSITTDEASIFPLAVSKEFVDFRDSTNIVIIDNRDSFNQFTQTDKPLIIITKFKIENIELRGAVQNGHKIIIPLSLGDEITSSEKIQLPILSRETFEMGLKNMGIDSEQAKILTKNSGRNISVLKRLLKFDDTTKPKYLDAVSIRDIIPILLINRFSENVDGDREIIEKVSGKTFDKYIEFLKILVTLEDAPVYYINGVWRLVSPNDAWIYFAKYVTLQDLKNFQNVSLRALSEVSHKYTLPLEHRENLYFTPKNRAKHSSILTEGICESLVVISAFGEDYGINCISNVSLYIDNIVQKILEMDIVVWRSLSRNLMLLAEASPNVFLNNLERILKEKSVTAFFEVERGFLNSSNDLAPLLWCLDIIAWFPEYLMRVSAALCEIILISPESFPTSNTPLSNLKSIYRPWYPQTNTLSEDRKRVLESLIKKYPDILYKLFYSLIEKKHDTAFSKPRPRYRLFSELREIQVKQGEFYYMREFFLDKIIELSKGNIEKKLALIDLLDDMELDKIYKALNTIEKDIEFHEEYKSQIYNKFRKFIGYHRSYPKATWSLPLDILDSIHVTAIKFKDDNDILSESYLFEEQRPEFIEGRPNNITKHSEEILSRRLEFVNVINEKYGIEKIFDLASKIDNSYLYGKILGLSDTISKKDRLVIYTLIDTENKSLLALVKEFIKVSERKTNLKTQTDILIDLIKKNLKIQGVNNFLDSLKDGIDLWNFISNLKYKDVEKFYWKSRQAFIYTENKLELFHALDKLQLYNNPITFLNTLGWGTYVHKDSLTSEEVLSSMEKISFSNLDDSSYLDTHHFESILEFLYSKDDYDLARGAKLELKFIYFFIGVSSISKPKNLFNLMSKNPAEYFNILSQVSLPDDSELRESELNKINENPNLREIFIVGRKILNSFNQIPSLNEDGSLNAEVLKRWIHELREIASNNFRIKITDNYIGELLAKYPINIKKSKGFNDVIYDIIEEIATDEVKTAFKTQIFNNLGSTTRGVFSGGNIERQRAQYFKKLFDETKFTHPNVALIFKTFINEYLSDAKLEDDDALLRSFQ